jgi:hypothetical protein
MVENEPVLVAACHCDFCQKRAGSSFGLNAYFSQIQCVALSGETNVFNGLEVDGIASANDKAIDYHFRTTCGSTVYWTVEAVRATPSSASLWATLSIQTSLRR